MYNKRLFDLFPVRSRRRPGDEAGHARMALKTVELMEKMTLQHLRGDTRSPVFLCFFFSR